MFKNFFILLLIFLTSPVFADTITGNIRKDEYKKSYNTVIDSKTNKPVEKAKVSIPQLGYYTTTDSEGRFQLNANIDDCTILQIEKEGYRPFSLTIGKEFENTPLRLGIEKTQAFDLQIETGVYHLGDNIYSPNSANCRQFRVNSIGPYYHKNIKLEKIQNGKEAVIIFGSIIGLDTKLAKELGQNGIKSVYSSPLQVIFNGQVISEISLNGDNQQIVIPNSLIKQNNDLVIQTGKNLFQFAYTDYDDMEFANLRIEVRDKVFAHK